MILERAVLEVGHVLLHVFHVCILAPSIEYNVEMVFTQLCNNAIVIDSTFIVHQKRQAGFARLQGLSIDDSNFLEESSCIFAPKVCLTHVGNIEDAAGSSCVKMLFQHAAIRSAVLNWHIISCKWYHLSSEFLLMIRMKLRDLILTSGKHLLPLFLTIR